MAPRLVLRHEKNLGVLAGQPARDASVGAYPLHTVLRDGRIDGQVLRRAARPLEERERRRAAGLAGAGQVRSTRQRRRETPQAAWRITSRTFSPACPATFTSASRLKSSILPFSNAFSRGC